MKNELPQRYPKHSFARCLWITTSFALVAAGSVSAQTYQLVTSFRNEGQPRADLLVANDGEIYGTTYWGGTSGVGTIFRLDDQGGLSTVHSFGYADGANVAAGLVQATDGNFYGTASRGGSHNLGTIFKMDPSGYVTRLHSFTGVDGATPVSALIEGADGDLYGVASEGGANSKGTVFRIALAGDFTVLHHFSGGDGSSPVSRLVQATDGFFYGTTRNGGVEDQGTVFRMDPAGEITTLRNLGLEDGILPLAGLIQASDGNLYGTTSVGGTYNFGSIYKLDAAGVFTPVHFLSYDDGGMSSAALIQGIDGSLYGTAPRGGSGDDLGTVFRVSLQGEYETLHVFDFSSGLQPVAGLVQTASGDFYGTTPSPYGSVFRIDTAGAFELLYGFPGPQVRGTNPLIQALDGAFYSTSFDGGSHGLGSVFKIDSLGSLTTVYSFSDSDGRSPGAGLTQLADGTFYGTTCFGGSSGLGTIFKIETSGKLETVHTFVGSDGEGCISALTQSMQGDLYGTTSNGGAYGVGTVFRIDSSGTFATIHDFDVVGPQYQAALLAASDGNFYGPTTGNTLFRIKPTGDFTTFHAFHGDDGSGPYGLVQATDGFLYGATEGGGPLWGTLFKVDLDGTLVTLHHFSFDDGRIPRASLIQATDGDLYGTTMYGGLDDGLSGNGTVFGMNTSGNLDTLHRFNGLDGGWPRAPLLQSSDGSLYGVTTGGGPSGGLGVIFRISSDAVAVNTTIPRSGPASGGIAAQIFGGGFSEDATVMIGGVGATDVSVADPSFLYFFTPPLSPGTLNDVTVANPVTGPSTATKSNAFFADFLDVPQTNPVHDYVERIFRAGITAGCGGGSYCPDAAVTRAQMAVFLLKAEHGSSFVPPPCNGFFADVPCPGMFADWIEQLAAEGITAGCGGANYCPSTPVTRAQMAVFLLKAEHGTGYVPQACTGIFGDVSCPSLFADWIEQLAAEQITGGCGGGNYCPGNPNTRGQMAVFLAKTFHL